MEQLFLECMSVAGAGVLHLPSSSQDAMKYRLVCEQPHPAEQGEATLGNITSVCRVADASQVWIHDGNTLMSSTVKGAALEALKRMGVYKLEMPLEVQLHKVLLHEPSGIFEFIQHKANEMGVFANMIIQLPSEGAFARWCIGCKSGQGMHDSRFLHVKLQSLYFILHSLQIASICWRMRPEVLNCALYVIW